MKNNKKKSIIVFSVIAITVLSLNLGLLRNDAYSKAPVRKGVLVEMNNGAYCCGPGTSSCPAETSTLIICESLFNPSNNSK